MNDKITGMVRYLILFAKVQRVKGLKNIAVKAQNYERGAKLRNWEREYMFEMDAIEENINLNLQDYKALQKLIK